MTIVSYASMSRHCSVATLLCLMLGAEVASAQQRCRSATDEARTSVTDYLSTPEEQRWLRAHGITATRVEDLQPLVDSDAGYVCVRMDSTLAPETGSYFRAGAFIIGTIAKPLVEGAPVYHFRSEIFVFDTLGARVHRDGIRVNAPADLRTASVLGTRVVLVWSRSSESLTGLQLQRATGGAAFTDIGAPLAATATTTADSTVIAGSSYLFRLAAVDAAGDTGYSNVVDVSVVDPGTITRSTSGLLFRDRFNRANGTVGTDWTTESGSWTIVDSALQVGVGGYQSLTLRLSAIPDRKDFHIQLLTTRSHLNNYAAIYARRSGGMMYLADPGSNTEHGGTPRLYRMTNGAYTLLGYGDMVSVANTPYRLTFSVIGTSLRYYADGKRLFSMADATAANNINGHFALNVYGSGATGTIRFDDVVVCSSRIVTMTGVPLGWTLRVGGIISESATASGTVSLDLLSTPIPVAQVEVLDDRDAVVKTFAPTNGVCGGDTYALTAP